MSDNNDFLFEEAYEAMLSALEPGQDMEKELNCAKCKNTILYKESVPISYEDEHGDRQTYRLCFACCKDYLDKFKVLERNFIRWFLRG